MHRLTCLELNRITKLGSHQAFFLLRHSFTIPRLTYTLRTTPCWRAMDSLDVYDQLLRISLEGIINCQLDFGAWMKCSLSVKCGGLGIRNVTSILVFDHRKGTLGGFSISTIGTKPCVQLFSINSWRIVRRTWKKQGCWQT